MATIQFDGERVLVASRRLEKVRAEQSPALIAIGEYLAVRRRTGGLEMMRLPRRTAHRYTQVPSCPQDAGIQCHGRQLQAILAAWIPAIPAGMTVTNKDVYNG
ncbi:hypothetical protein [Methylomonas koyamae]|uniref:Uncharacterized protein n=1 Tax=Methylomonas koyamae TaxID=702114 RepID=A0AA91D9F9_9GAMM|nr:hypothetical protein [Methylomonas koyamae]OAI21872.1 hypothetical protein A1356_20270 [Methylomonas koyamae]